MSSVLRILFNFILNKMLTKRAYQARGLVCKTPSIHHGPE